MSFCTECGERLNIGEQYCSRCGEAVKVEKFTRPAQNAYKLFWIAGALIFILIIFVLINQRDRFTQTTYVNLTVGARSEYSLVFTSSWGSGTGKMITYIESEEVIDGKKYFKMLYEMNIPDLGLREVTYTYLREDRDGIYALAEGYLQYPEYLVYPLPLSVGKTWAVNDPRGTLHYRVESRENVVIEGRTYRNCYKLSYYGEIESVGVEGYEFIHQDIASAVKIYMYFNDLDITIEAVHRQ
jgi:predicted nucleic acid-binding Zn ribbon protein